MKCYVCKYESDRFGIITALGTSEHWSSLIGSLPNYGHVGSVNIHVCPNCGALHSDMRNNIKDKDRHA